MMKIDKSICVLLKKSLQDQLRTHIYIADNVGRTYMYYH